jgi:cell division protein FtsQ
LRLKSKKKRDRNKKIKSAYRRGERAILVLKTGLIIISSIVFALAVALGVKQMVRSLHVRDIVVYGNYHLEEKDIEKMLDTVRGMSLLSLGFHEVDEALRLSPWIKKVSMRKQFPHTLQVRIEEAVPKALLNYRGNTYLLEQEGEVLEEIRGEVASFLPIISGVDPDQEREGLLESLKLLEALEERNILSSRESVEVSLQSYGPEMNIDGETIKVGYGNYSEKLARWQGLQPQMSKIGPSSYIDLRFQDKVIVKPFRIVGKKANIKG